MINYYIRVDLTNLNIYYQKKWTVEDIGKVLEKTELELEKRGMKTTKRTGQRKLFRQKVKFCLEEHHS